VNRRQLAWVAAAAAAGVAIVAIYAWPGYMVQDAMDQLAQARAGEFTDWHPPVMAVLWGVLDRIVAGPALMLVLQCASFAGALFVLLRRRTSARWALVGSLLVLAFPPVLAAMGVVVKDSLMCGALLVGCAAITSDRPRAQLASLAAFAFAAALRHNALAAVIPLIAWLAPWPRSRGTWVRRGVGLAIGLAVSASGLAANQAFGPKPGHMFWFAIAPQDIVGTLCFAPELDDVAVRELVGDASPTPALDLQAHACASYDPNRFWEDLFRGPTGFFARPDAPEQLAGMRAAWLRVLRAHTGAYLWNRIDRTREFLGLTDTPWEPVFAAQHERHMLLGTNQPERPRNHLQRWLARRMVELGASSVWFRPYLYVLLSCVLLIVQRRDRLVVALQLSSFAYLLLLVFVSPGPDPRYAQWTVVTVLVGLVMHAIASWTSGTGGAPPRAPPS
jgi:hypothetical protein